MFNRWKGSKHTIIHCSIAVRIRDKIKKCPTRKIRLIESQTSIKKMIHHFLSEVAYLFLAKASTGVKNKNIVMSVSVLGDIWVFIFQQICQQEQCVR